MNEIENNLEDRTDVTKTKYSIGSFVFLTNSKTYIKKTLKKTIVKLNDRKVKRVFQSLKFFIPDEINFKYFKWNLKKNKNNSSLAWKLFIILTTSILANKIPNEEGNFKLILNGIYSIFKDIKKNLLEYEGAKITTEVTLTLLNKELRPFLGKWHSKNINQEFNIIDDDFKKELIALQDTICNKYLEKFSDLSTLYHNNNKIKKYINH